MLAPMLIAAMPMSDVAMPEGARLREGSACYTLTRAGKPTGQTWQRVRAAMEGQMPVWDVIVHQRAGEGRFDMRDHFVLRRSDLRPLRMDSRRNGVEHVRVRYDGASIAVTRPNKPETQVSAPGAVRDGNLWGLTLRGTAAGRGADLCVALFPV